MSNNKKNQKKLIVPSINDTKEIYEKANNTLLEDLEFLSEETNYHLLNEALFMPLETQLSTNSNFYNEDEIREKLYSDAAVSLLTKTTDDLMLKRIIQLYIASPFGIFTFIKEIKVSDIFIIQNKISFTNTNNERTVNIEIPDHLKYIYNRLVDKFINLTIYSSDLQKTKFDRVNAILDYEVDKIRFNVTHPSLNANNTDSPIIALRNQLLDFSRDNLDIKVIKNRQRKYIASQNLSKEQENFVNNLSVNGSYIIFGETGSGKTTLMKYMGNYHLEDKRNMITIEDTPELFIPVNITYLTNDNYSIRDLFKVSLRENPSHLLIGETRGDEIIEMLESGLVFKVGSTLHADSFTKCITRILFLIKSSDSHYSSSDIKTLITSVIDGFIWMNNRHVVKIWKRKDSIESLDDVINNYEEVL